VTRLQHSPSGWHKSHLFILVLLAIVTAAAYFRVVQYDFINWDDEEYIGKNQHVITGITIGNVRWAFTTTHAWNWHPLTWLSLQLDAAVWGIKQPGGFHATNLVFHIANAVLLFGVLCRMTQSQWRSAVVAGLFALHPLHVESVAWVTERKDVLSTFFWILTMGAYVGYVERPGVRRYALVVLSFALGLMAKPMLVTLPVVLLLLDYWPVGERRAGGVNPGSGRAGHFDPVVPHNRNTISPAPRSPVAAFLTSRLLLEKVPLLVLSVASAAVTLYAQRDALRSTDEFSLAERMANALEAYVAYLGKTFWPTNLSVFYPFDRNPHLWSQAGDAVLLVFITLTALWRRNERYLLVGWLWFLITLLPVVGIVQVGLQRMADRYTYIPLIGVFIALVWGAADLVTALRLPRWLPASAAVVMLAACSWATYVQVGYWQNSFTIWEQAIRVEPSSLAHRNLGACLARQHKDMAALKQFELAVACDPSDVQSQSHLAAMRSKLELERRRR
jgi:hypothetical protein